MPIDDDSIDDFLLNELDFPRDYKEMKHPDDYKIVDSFPANFKIYSNLGKHTRLLARVAWKTNNEKFIPMTFVCNTGAPGSFYLSVEARDILRSKGILKNTDLGSEYVEIKRNDIESFKVRVENTPHAFRNANVIGLKLLMVLGLRVTEEGFSFISFNFF